MDSTLTDIAEAVERDLLGALFKLNGWPVEAIPSLEPEAVQYRDIVQIAVALRDLAAAGAVLSPDDPAIDEIRALAGLSPQPEGLRELDASLGRREERQEADEGSEDSEDLEEDAA